MRRFGRLNGHDFRLDVTSFSRARSSFDGRRLRGLAKRCGASLLVWTIRAKGCPSITGRQHGEGRFVEGAVALHYGASRSNRGRFRMIVLRRSVAAVAFALTLVGLTVPDAVLAQDYPTPPVKIIVPFGAGGAPGVESPATRPPPPGRSTSPFCVAEPAPPGSTIAHE